MVIKKLSAFHQLWRKKLLKEDACFFHIDIPIIKQELKDMGILLPNNQLEMEYKKLLNTSSKHILTSELILIHKENGL